MWSLPGLSASALCAASLAAAATDPSGQAPAQHARDAVAAACAAPSPQSLRQAGPMRKEFHVIESTGIVKACVFVSQLPALALQLSSLRHTENQHVQGGKGSE